MILVAGATGLVGLQICLKLAQRHTPFRALVRHTSDPAKIATLEAAGAQLVYGDLKEPASLAAACKDIEAIISTASSTISHSAGDSIETVDHQGQLNLVQAARQAGIDRFLFLSFRKPQGVEVPLAQAKTHVENAIAGMNHTILLCSFFMETWLGPHTGFDYANARARIYGRGTSPLSWVSAGDVAEVSVRAINHPATYRRAFDFGGPDALSPLEVVRLFERLSGRTFELEHIPVDVLYAQFAAADNALEKSYAALGLGLAQGEIMDTTAIAQELGLTLTSVETYARAVLNL